MPIRINEVFTKVITIIMNLFLKLTTYRRKKLLKQFAMTFGSEEISLSTFRDDICDEDILRIFIMDFIPFQVFRILSELSLKYF